MINSTTPKIVRKMARIIAHAVYGCGPVPKKIGGKGIIQITAPAEAPKKTDAIINRIIPMKIKRKPKRNSLKGSGQNGTPEISFGNGGVFCLSFS